MKKVIFLLLGLVLILPAQSMAAVITVDGDMSDWSGIAPLLTDAAGNGYVPSNDITSLRIIDDASYVYFLAEFVGDPSADTTYGTAYFLDTDTDPTTGHYLSYHDIGMEYGITMKTDFAYGGYIGDARDGTWSSIDFPGALSTGYGTSFIEFSIPIATLEVLTPGITAFDFGNSGPVAEVFVVRYTLTRGVSVPEPSTMALMGTGLLGVFLFMRRHR